MWGHRSLCLLPHLSLYLTSSKIKSLSNTVLFCNPTSGCVCVWCVDASKYEQHQNVKWSMCTRMFVKAQSVISRSAINLNVDQLMNTSRSVAQTYRAVHFNYKKNEILSSRTAQMGTEIMMLSEIYQHRQRSTTWSLTEFIKVDPLEVGSRKVVTRGWGE